MAQQTTAACFDTRTAAGNARGASTGAGMALPAVTLRHTEGEIDRERTGNGLGAERQRCGKPQTTNS